MRIIIRTLGGESIGYGHFFRCLSLSKAIINLCNEIEIIFLVNEKLVNLLKKENLKYIISNCLEKDIDIISNFDIDLFIVDTYLGDDNYLKIIKKQSKIMLIDDNNDTYDSTLANILYNGNIHASKLNYPFINGHLRLLGLKYLIMKEEYWYSEKNDEVEKKGILITTGGSDEYEIALDIINAIKSLNIKARVIIGPGYKMEYINKIECLKNENIELIYSPISLKEYIEKSKIVITAGGSTVYEVLSRNSIPIIFSFADNQQLLCEELSNKDLLYLGRYPQINYVEMKNYLKRINNSEVKNKGTFKLLDGKGALRVAENILNFLK